VTDASESAVDSSLNLFCLRTVSIKSGVLLGAWRMLVD
jgi:hypothetical protein